MDLTRDTSIFLLVFIILSIYIKQYIYAQANYFLHVCNEHKENRGKKKIKIGVLTNELPPIIYGGVSTWVLNFMNMFKDDDEYECVPIFLAYLDKAPDNFHEMYPGIRIINCENDIYHVFSDIDVVVNNLWIALDTIEKIKSEFPTLPIISVCHSLIKMEHITNLGSQYTNNFGQQEVTFQKSDFVVYISNAEKEYAESFGYDKFDAKSVVIHNMYSPKYDNKKVFDNYDVNHVGYIGRHVPRKRPELAILAIDKMNLEEIKVINMGVDFNKGGNDYWVELREKYKKQLEIIEFTCDKKVKQQYYNSIGANVCSFTYEPFGYVACECLDMRIPLIVGNLDGPKEITEKVKDFVYLYDVDKDSMEKDIASFSETFEKFLLTSPKQRKENAEKARKALDDFRPEKIKKHWLKLFNCCNNVTVVKDDIESPKNVKLKKEE